MLKANAQTRPLRSSVTRAEKLLEASGRACFLYVWPAAILPTISDAFPATIGSAGDWVDQGSRGGA